MFSIINLLQMPNTIYNAPLTPVRPRSQSQKLLGCDLPKEKVPYSKYTVPHFMDIDDEEKYIVNGKCHLEKAFSVSIFVVSIFYIFIHLALKRAFISHSIVFKNFCMDNNNPRNQKLLLVLRFTLFFYLYLQILDILLDFRLLRTHSYGHESFWGV